MEATAERLVILLRIFQQECLQAFMTGGKSNRYRVKRWHVFSVKVQEQVLIPGIVKGIVGSKP